MLVVLASAAVLLLNQANRIYFFFAFVPTHLTPVQVSGSSILSNKDGVRCSVSWCCVSITTMVTPVGKGVLILWLKL